MSKCRPSFFGPEGSCAVVAISMALCFLACVPPRYFLPVSTLDSCLALTSNLSQASFAVPSLKYLQFNFNHTAAASIRVGPFFSLWARQGAFGMGRTIFRTFSHLSSSFVLARLSSTRFRKPSSMFIWTRGLTAPFMMVWRVVLSVILARALMFAQTADRCSWACAACSKMSAMKAVSSAHLVLLGSCQMNSGPVGISSGGSNTSTPPLVRC